MSNTSAPREQSIEVIAMPNAMLKQCIGACCNKLWCKWDKISFQPEFSIQWSTKYLEKKKPLVTGCIKAAIKMYWVFLCLKKKKSMNLKLHMFEWYFKKKKKTPKQILVLFYGDLWKSWNLQPIFLLPRQNGDARCHCQDLVCESLFCALQKKKRQLVCKSTAWSKGRARLEKGDVGEKCIRVDCSRHYRLFNDCPRKMKCSWCVGWDPPDRWVTRVDLVVNFACKWEFTCM